MDLFRGGHHAGLVLLPSQAPELQLVERLWGLTDTPQVNQHFESLEQLRDTLETYLSRLESQYEHIRTYTLLHWWPRITLLIQSESISYVLHFLSFGLMKVNNETC